MKKYILGAAFFLAVLVTPLAPAQAAGLSDTQVQAILSLLSAFGADSATIASVNSALTGTAPATNGSQSFCHDFYDNLTIGATDKGSGDISALNRALMLSGIEPSGNTFDDGHAAGVVIFQRNNSIRQTGYVGPMTRAKLNALYGCSNSQTNQNGQTMNVGQTPTITVTSPNGNAWQYGTNQTIRWTDSAYASGVSYTVFATQKNGAAYGIIANKVIDTSFEWRVGTLSDGTQIAPYPSDDQHYYIQIVRQTAPQAHSANAPFTTSPSAPISTTAPTITVTYPNSGEQFVLGKNVDFRTTWNSQNLSGNVSVYLNFADGATCLLGTVPVSQGTFPVSALNADGSSHWCSNISRTITAGQYKILLDTDTNPNDNVMGIHDSSDAYFTYVNPSTSTIAPTITGISPNGGEVLQIGQTYAITWSSANLPASAPIEIVLKDTRYYGDTPQANSDIIQTTNTGRYYWTIPQNLNSYMSLGAGNVYKIWVRSSYGRSVGAYEAGSISNFSIVPATTTVAPSAVDTPSGTLSLSSSTGGTGCIIRNGQSDCTVSAYWSTTGVSSVTLVNDKGAAFDNHSPNVAGGYSAFAVAVAYGGTTFNLKNTATGGIISSRFATADCEPGTSWNTTPPARCANTPAPSLSSFAPTAITAGSNTSIVIYGSGFKSGATIIFSGTSSGESPAASYVSSDGGQMNIGSYVFGYAGTWTFRVKNPDGQMSGGSGTFTITAPTVAPTVQSFSLPSTVNVNDTLTATWTGSSNAASYQFNATGINGGAFSPLTSASSWSGTAASLGFSAGTTYVMGIRACTSDGTCGNPSYRTIAINAPVVATAPAAPVLTVQSFTLSATTVGLNDTFNASWTGSSDATSYQFNANGINGGAFSPLTTSSSWSGTAASLGFSAGTSYAIGIRACNSSGTCGTPSYATIAVTGTPATISIGVTGTTLYWSASSNASSCSWRVNGAPFANLSPLTGTSPLVGVGLTVGTAYTIQAYCLNSSGQQGSTATLVYTPTVVVNTDSVRQTASAIDAFNSASDANASGTTSGFHYAWSRGLGIGSLYAFDVTALQTALTREGMYQGDVSGGFYSQTYGAVKTFQQKYGIEATGFVGSQTRSKLNSLYSR